ncbi:MAG TPA: hypothetical protein VMM93_14050 [Vicinamibacterales bacterium]|nr:hypothetical protein [Vicinamibacterales bacterium]
MNRIPLAFAVVCCTTLAACTSQAAPGEAAPGLAASALRQDMRMLWSDHVIWTRSYIVAAIADAPDQQAAATRLMRNQDELGSAIAAYYGEAAGNRMTTLLKEHISIAVELVTAARTGNTSGQAEADARWQQNGVDIADFLSEANPNWPRAALVDMMKTHLSTTTAEVVARLGGNWDADVRAFDEAYRHILMMSDTLADGIVEQFPDRFSPMVDRR